MAESSERGNEAEKQPSKETLEDFREEIEEEHGPEGLDKPKNAPAEEPVEPGGDSSETREAHREPNPDLDENREGRLSNTELEEARRRILQSYGEDGLEAVPEAAQDANDGAEPPVDESEQNRRRDRGAQERNAEDIDTPQPVVRSEGVAAEQKPKEESPKIEGGTDMGSFSRNDDQVVVTQQELGTEGPEKASSASVETSDLHRFPGDSEARAEAEPEARTLEAVDYGKGAVVRVPKTALERAGYEPKQGEDAVVQLGLRNAESEEVETVFARYNASDRRAEAYVGEIGGEKGSRYELVEARGVDEDSLVRGFQRGRCEHLQNVRLEHADEKMFLNVDNRRVKLEDYRISTSGSHAVVRGRLDGEDSCKIEFDGLRASVMFGRDYPVEGMKVKDDVLSVKYEQSRNEKHEARLHLEHVDAPERPSLNQFDQPLMLEHLRLLNRPPGNEGMYQVSLDKASRDEIEHLLAEAPDYGMMKAEVSERLVPNLLESLGWERIERHPFTKTWKENAGSNGTDWLMRDPEGDMVLVEVKWYENRRDAIRKATLQVERDFQTYKDDSDLDLRAAYIAIVEHDERSVNEKPMKIHVLRVVSKEELR